MKSTNNNESGHIITHFVPIFLFVSMLSSTLWYAEQLKCIPNEIQKIPETAHLEQS